MLIYTKAAIWAHLKRGLPTGKLSTVNTCSEIHACYTTSLTEFQRLDWEITSIELSLWASRHVRQITQHLIHSSMTQQWSRQCYDSHWMKKLRCKGFIQNHTADKDLNRLSDPRASCSTIHPLPLLLLMNSQPSFSVCNPQVLARNGACPCSPSHAHHVGPHWCRCPS